MADKFAQASSLLSHQDALAKNLDVSGKRVLDVGCGGGGFTRAMTLLGARVTGIDPGERQLKKARSEAPAGDEEYIEGIAQALPDRDSSVDIVVFFNSLHHVPIDQLDDALAETGRVLVDDGMAYIAEPLATGPMFELNKIINNETEVRAKAYEAIKGATAQGFKEVTEFTYVTDRHYPDFEAYRENSISINPAREALFEVNSDAMRERFEAYGEKQDDGIHFPQPIRVNILTKS